jgi:hypothetical protein
MPQQSNIGGRNVHAEAPAAVTGYPLGPVVGFWSLVSAAGSVLNLVDLGIQVLAYTGAGMAPIQNLTTPYALIGGDYYQRTVARPRSITLMCFTGGKSIAELQKIRKTLISYIAPDNSLQQAAQIKLRFATTDNCGAVVGQTLEVPVNYVGGLEGNTDNLYQERFALQFVEYAPPSIKELSTNSNALGFKTSQSSGVETLYLRDAGAWSTTAVINGGQVNAMLYDQTDVLWYGTGDRIANFPNTVTQATVGDVVAMALLPDNSILFGGHLTSPASGLLIKYDRGSGTFVTYRAGLTGTNVINAVAVGFDGTVYVIGDMSSPQAGCAKTSNGGVSWQSLTAGSGVAGIVAQPVGLVRGLDGHIYLGGPAGMTVDALGSNRVYRYNTTTLAFQNLPPTGSNPGLGSGAVNAVCTLPNGWVVFGGSFGTTRAGVTVNNVMAFNGSNLIPLGTGLNNTVNYLFSTPDGKLYAVGNFTGPGGNAYALPDGLALWNGSVWLPVDIDLPAATSVRAVAGKSTGGIAIEAAPASAPFASTVTAIVNAGTANAVPTFIFTGPGQMYNLVNNTTGKNIYFNYLLLAGETATLVLDPTALTFTSNFTGNVLNKILPGSDLATFNLVPGTNSLSCLISGTTTGATSATLQYRNTHWTFDASGV